MEYIVFHATITLKAIGRIWNSTPGTQMEPPISSDAEMQRVIQSIQAAIERRDTQGLRLELCTEDRPGLLADVTRTFRENGLNVTMAEISTSGNMALNIFYVTGADGYPAHPKTIEAVREKIGLGNLKVKELPLACRQKAEGNEAWGWRFAGPCCYLLGA
ncbi:hypothetical protein Ancab_032535 [Ancistrocladus abbreviatus]